MAVRWCPSRTGRGLTAVASLGAAVVLASACSAAGDGDAATAPPAPSPEASYTTCPRLAPQYLPADWMALDSELVNLGDRVMGRVDTFGAGNSSAEVHVGVDGLEALEDLDFESRPVEVEGRSLRFHDTPVQPGLLAVSWQEGAEPCGSRSVISRGLPEAELVRFVLGLSPDTGAAEAPA